MPQVNTKAQLQVYTGNGKGKTTAALGLAIRAAGRGKRVCIIYFDKGGENYGERKILDELKGRIDYVATGLDRIDPETRVFRFGVLDEDKKEAARGLNVAREKLHSGEYDLVICDELNSTLALGMLDKDSVLRFIDERPDNVELVITGRNATPEILERADLVTEMVLTKHYFYNGVPAREGIEY